MNCLCLQMSASEKHTFKKVHSCRCTKECNTRSCGCRKLGEVCDPTFCKCESKKCKNSRMVEVSSDIVITLLCVRIIDIICTAIKREYCGCKEDCSTRECSCRNRNDICDSNCNCNHASCKNLEVRMFHVYLKSDDLHKN